MYNEPLLPGQEFSFMEPVVVALSRSSGLHESDGWVLLPAASDTSDEQKFIASTDMRFIALENTYVDPVGCWRVPVWFVTEWSTYQLMSFPQRVSQEVAEYIFDPSVWQNDQPGAIPVVDVRWPAPTRWSLMIHVRALSYWGEVAPWHNTPNANSISWEWCKELAKLPLRRGLPRAIKALTQYIPDPSSTLRERGFNS
jgi:hypothetical protein